SPRKIRLASYPRARATLIIGACQTSLSSRTQNFIQPHDWEALELRSLCCVHDFDVRIALRPSGELLLVYFAPLVARIRAAVLVGPEEVRSVHIESEHHDLRRAEVANDIQPKYTTIAQ